MEGVAHWELSVVIQPFCFFSRLFRVGAIGLPQLGQQHSTNDTAATPATANSNSDSTSVSSRTHGPPVRLATTAQAKSSERSEAETDSL